MLIESDRIAAVSADLPSDGATRHRPHRPDAERMLLPASTVVVKPTGLGFTETTAFPLTAAAASATLDHIDQQSGQAVLVTVAPTGSPDQSPTRSNAASPTGAYAAADSGGRTILEEQ